MVNVKQELSNYSAINLNELIENGSQITDNQKNSFILYNKALESLKSDSEDMAVIELKKALSMYPDFPEAMNLLGLGYIYMKDYAKASAVFEQVIIKENCGVLALKYLNSINTNEQLSTSTGKKKTDEGVNSVSFINDVMNINRNWKRDILKYVAGLIAGALIFFAVQYLFFSSTPSSKDVSTVLDTVKVDSKKDASYEKKYNGLQQDYKKLQSDLKAANSEISYFQNVNRLNDVQNFYTQRNYEAAADLLILLKSVNFKDSDKQKFDSLYSQTMPNALYAVLNSGINLFSTAKYQEAIQKLNKITLYDGKWPSIDRAYYYIGKSYFALNDTKKALETFQKVVAGYPGSKYAGYSQNYINQLTTAQ